MIDHYVREIRSCLEGGNYFAALSLTLTLPDVCGNAEYPDKRVGERYIAWYDDYIGSALREDRGFEEVAYLSGEIVYNLRNQFLHQGEVRLATSKIRDEGNRVDRFTLLLGDGTKVYSMRLTLNAGDVWCRSIVVDVTLLCELVCDAAERYYASNGEKFMMTVDVITQEYLLEGKGGEGVTDGDPLRDALNQKLQESGEDIRIVDNVTRRLVDSLARTISATVADEQAETEGTGAE